MIAAAYKPLPTPRKGFPSIIKKAVPTPQQVEEWEAELTADRELSKLSFEERQAKFFLDNVIAAVRDGRNHTINLNFEDPGEPPLERSALWPSAFKLLDKYGLWPEALRQIAAVDKVHPKAKQRFIFFWQCLGWMLRGSVCDELLFAALRKLLPRYHGGPVELFRGQAAGAWVGLSWTSHYDDAELFARAALKFNEPVKGVPEVPPMLWPVKKAVVLKATVPHAQVISGPLKAFTGDILTDTEHVIDPTKVSFEIVETFTNSRRQVQRRMAQVHKNARAAEENYHKQLDAISKLRDDIHDD